MVVTTTNGGVIQHIYIKHSDMILSSTGEQLLTGAGKISHGKAMEKAKLEYKKYQVKLLVLLNKNI